MIDRRFDIRAPRRDTVSLRWTDPTGQALERPGSLADISASGASVRTRDPVKVGTVLSLAHQDQEFTGKVKHCASAPTGYLVGIEFQNP